MIIYVFSLPPPDASATPMSLPLDAAISIFFTLYATPRYFADGLSRFIFRCRYADDADDASHALLILIRCFTPSLFYATLSITSLTPCHDTRHITLIARVIYYDDALRRIRPAHYATPTFELSPHVILRIACAIYAPLIHTMPPDDAMPILCALRQLLCRVHAAEAAARAALCCAVNITAR